VQEILATDQKTSIEPYNMSKMDSVFKQQKSAKNHNGTSAIKNFIVQIDSQLEETNKLKKDIEGVLREINTQN
jgi:hypothetical protein